MKQFYIDADRGYAILLGYIMPLTKTELRILKYIYESDGYVGAEAIKSEILNDKSIILGNISVHICNINKKSKRISNRAIIKSCRYKGYKMIDTI